jgi:hypothetical protein
MMSRGSSWLLAERPGFVSRPALGTTQFPIHWVLVAVFLAVKWPRREADDSPPSGVEGKNGGGVPPLPHTSS